MKALLTKLLYKIPHKDIGWEAIGEKFTRFHLVKSPWFNVYLHRLDAPNWHPECHSHPWSFVTFLLWGGYWEQVGREVFWRRPGTILYRPAEFVHNVITGGVSWSLIITSPKRRDWGFHTCERGEA